MHITLGRAAQNQNTFNERNASIQIGTQNFNGHHIEIELWCVHAVRSLALWLDQSAGW